MPDTDEKKTSENRKKKEVIVAKIVDRLESANGLVFANYEGLTHKQIEELKKQLKEVSATFAITKNTLLKLSLKQTEKFKDFADDDIFVEPTATVFISGDSVEALKKLTKSQKDLGLPTIKFGILDGVMMDEAQVIKLSTLPNKQTLIAQFVGTLNSPITGLVYVLSANMQKLVMVLNAIAQSKPAQTATPEPTAAPAPVAEPTTPVAEETPTATEEAPVQAEAEPAATEAPPAEEPAQAEVKTENTDQVSEGGENS